MFKIEKPKNPSYRCHYSNPSCQGTIISETFNFPTEVETLENYHTVYADRLESNTTKLVSNFLGVNERVWSDKLRDNNLVSYNPEYDGFYSTRKNDTIKTINSYSVSENEIRDTNLKELAKIMFNLDKLPNHVRVVYWYNVSNGYPCPSFECIL